MTGRSEAIHLAVPGRLDQATGGYIYDRRIVEGLRALGLETPWPRGAFYAFPRVAPFLDARGSAGFCEDLLEEQNLAVVPGSAFGVEEHVRFSYATSLDVIEKALARFAAFLAPRQAQRVSAARR